MERAARFVIRHTEPLVVALILASVLLIHFFVAQSVTMIAFYFLPVLLAGYTQGSRLAVLTAVFSAAAVVFWAVVSPSSFTLPPGSWNVSVHLAAWAGFLILSAVVVGRLYSEKEKRLVAIRAAYAGILEILFAYLDSPRKNLRRHVGRVAEQAAHIAMHTDMSGHDVEVVRTAALLHEMGALKVSPDLVRRAADLSLREKRMMELHCQEGGTILERLGAVLQQALPAVMAHQELCATDVVLPETLSQASPCVQILHVADVYDVLTEAQGLSPDDAASEILRTMQRSIRPEILEAFAKVADLSHVAPPRADGDPTIIRRQPKRLFA